MEVHTQNCYIFIRSNLNAHTRTCAHTPSPRSSLLLEHSLLPTPSPLREMA